MKDNYLTEDDLNEELIEEILKIHLEDIGVSVNPKYISDRLLELKSYIFECIKGDLRLWDLIENVKESLILNLEKSVNSWIKYILNLSRKKILVI